ncbi:MAG: adenosylcobinamide-phosphate synthase CbiB [Pseudomonadota bacterium]
MTAWGTLLAVAVALGLDRLLSEPTRFHPIVGFGLLASRLESSLNRGAERTRFCTGTASALILIVVPSAAVGCILWISDNIWINFIIESLCLYAAIGWQSMRDHAHSVRELLSLGKRSDSAQALSMIVSRDTANMTAEQISGSTIESVLENSNDSLFASLFWFGIGGAPMVVAHRLSNTLDAMWGYKNEKYLWFGKFAARLDDVMGWLPAQLTAIAFAFASLSKTGFLRSMTCWREQGLRHKSPSGGPVMASGAGALNIEIGGPVSYEGKIEKKPWLGSGPKSSAADINRAIGLAHRALVLWLAVWVAAVLFWS